MKPKVCFVLSDVPQPSSRWLGYAAQALSASSCTFSDLERRRPAADIYVIEHNLGRAWYSGALRGKRVFVWLDDAVWRLPIDTPQRAQWNAAWPTVLRLAEHVSAFITPSRVMQQALADMLHKTCRVVFIPNYHNFEYQPVVERTSRLGWGGSFYHWTSWRDTARDWRTVLAGESVEIVGHDFVAAMLQNADIAATSVPVAPYAEYLDLVARWRAMVIPLHGPYDECRSWIKALEACWCGTPWLGLGDAVDTVYRGVPGRITDLAEADTVNRAALHAWAAQQRVTDHVAEWQDVLYS